MRSIAAIVLLFVLTSIGMAGLVPMRAAAATLGTDVLSFGGTSTAFAAPTTINTPSGTTVTLPAGTYNVNNTTYDGLAGIDTLVMTSANDVLSQSQGDVLRNVEFVVLGAGNDIIDLSEAYGIPLTTNMNINGGSGDDVIIANAGNDTLRGFGGSDYIFGGSGFDNIDGGADDDYLDGGSGLNTYIVDDSISFGNDIIDLRNGAIGSNVLFTTNSTAASLFDQMILSVAGSVSRIKVSVRDGQGATIGSLTFIEDWAIAGGTISTFIFGVDGSNFARNDILPTVTFPTAPVPVPATAWLLGLGLAAFGLVRRRRA